MFPTQMETCCRLEGRFPSLRCPCVLHPPEKKTHPGLMSQPAFSCFFFPCACVCGRWDEGLCRSTRLDRKPVRNVKGLDLHQGSSGSIVLLTPDYQQSTCHVSPSLASQCPLTFSAPAVKAGWGQNATHMHARTHTTSCSSRHLKQQSKMI